MAQTESGPVGSNPAACSVPEYQRPSAYSRHAVFVDCPHCGGDMAPEHAHFRCQGCGWRDSCCD